MVESTYFLLRVAADEVEAGANEWEGRQKAGGKGHFYYCGASEAEISRCLFWNVCKQHTRKTSSIDSILHASQQCQPKRRRSSNASETSSHPPRASTRGSTKRSVSRTLTVGTYLLSGIVIESNILIIWYIFSHLRGYRGS